MKQNIRALISSRKIFFIALLMIVLAVLSMAFFGKTFIMIPRDTYHPFWLNVFFINYTFMGNGLFVVCLSLVLIFRFKRKQIGTAILNSFLLSAIVIEVFKNISNIFQPTIFIEQGQNLFSGNDAYANNFISGHTLIAFSLATVLILTKNSKWQLPLLFAALLLGFSRIYLAQHFLLDILISASLGTITGTIAVYFAYYYKRPRYNYRKFLSMNRRGGSIAEGNIQPV